MSPVWELQIDWLYFHINWRIFIGSHSRITVHDISWIYCYTYSLILVSATVCYLSMHPINPVEFASETMIYGQKNCKYKNKKFFLHPNVPWGKHLICRNAALRFNKFGWGKKGWRGLKKGSDSRNFGLYSGNPMCARMLCGVSPPPPHTHTRTHTFLLVHIPNTYSLYCTYTVL